MGITDKVSPWEKIFTWSVLGFVVFTLVSFILIVLRVPFLIIPVTLLSIAFKYKAVAKAIRNLQFKLTLRTATLLVVFILGIAGQMAVIAPSGTFQNGDLVFWSAHGHDGSWHIALMEEIQRGWPFQNPVFAGERLVNYHFFSDVAPAIIGKYLPISNLDLYFRIFPFFYSLLLGASAYYLTKRLTGSTSASIWVVIFTYFAGSFGFIATYIKDKTIGGESIFWATQPQSASGNPPQIISDFLILSALYFVLRLIQKKDKLSFVASVLIIGTLAVFKVYGAIVLLGAIFIAGAWQLLRDKNFQLLALAIVSTILAAALYLPNSSGSTSFLIFEPWWYIRTMIVDPGRLNWLDHELRRQTYIFENNWKRVIYLEGIAFLIFFFGNLGIRFIGIWDFIKSAKNSYKSYFNLVFVLTIILSLIFPLLFLQKGVAGNTSQFLQYFVLLFGILAGISTAKLLANIKFSAGYLIATVLIILFMIPTQVGLLREFYSRPAFAKVSKAELEALEFIKSNTNKDTVILTPPYDQYLNLGGSTPQIWDWFDTGYVAAFSSRRTYFDDYEQVDIMGYDYKPRLEIKRKIFTDQDAANFENLIKQTQANLLYYPKALKPKTDPAQMGLTKFFENAEVEIWKI